MVTGPPDRHPEMQAAVDRAAGELARLLRANPYPKNPDAFAREFVEWQYGGPDHWRPVPRTKDVPEQGRRDPDTAHRGAAMVRAALPRKDER